MILDVIREIAAEKRAAHIVPDYVMYTEAYNRVGVMRKDFSAALRELRDAGFIRIGRTINDFYIQLIEDDL